MRGFAGPEVLAPFHLLLGSTSWYLPALAYASDSHVNENVCHVNTVYSISEHSHLSVLIRSNPSNFSPCLNLLLDYNNLLLDYNNLLPDYNKPIIIYYYYNPRININPSCPLRGKTNSSRTKIQALPICKIPVNTQGIFQSCRVHFFFRQPFSK